MKKAKLVILRHGQTEYNKQHLMTGKRDVPLTAVGEDQARTAGKLLDGFVFDHVFSSNLSRAFNTAALALGQTAGNDHLKKPDGTWHIIQDEDIAELDTGVFTGRNHKKDPEIVNFQRGFYKPLPGGESQKEVVDRVDRFFQTHVLPKLAAGENVLVVCHAGIVRAFDFVLGVEDIPADGSASPGGRRIPNATPQVFEYENGKLSHSFQIDNPKELAAANQNKPAQNVPKPKNNFPGNR